MTQSMVLGKAFGSTELRDPRRNQQEGGGRVLEGGGTPQPAALAKVLFPVGGG